MAPPGRSRSPHPTPGRGRGVRFLFYTNECVGLGHLRRTLNLAEAVTTLDPDASALVITGAPTALNERAPERIDIVKLPELSRNRDGGLRAARLGVDTGHLHDLRAHLAFAAAETFEPSVVVVDKTPLGLNDELVPTLEALRAADARIVLGLRDIEDAPDAVRLRWTVDAVRSPITRLYDRVLVYGPEGGTDALACLGWGDLAIPVHHVGYVGSAMPRKGPRDLAPGYLLVTAGGGVDGFPVFDAVLGALEHAPIPHRTVMVTGPLMPPVQRRELTRRAVRLGVQLFDSRTDMPSVITGACAVVTMAGYNTVSEVVRAGKAALLMPRTGPSREQLVRAESLAASGAAAVILPDDAAPAVMSAAIAELLTRRAPAVDPALHDGAARAAAILCELANEAARPALTHTPLALESNFRATSVPDARPVLAGTAAS